VPGMLNSVHVYVCIVCVYSFSTSVHLPSLSFSASQRHTHKHTSSGNTAAAIAMQCSVRGYKSILITNTKCSQEKINALAAYGGEVMVTPSGLAPDHPGTHTHTHTHVYT
jgi:threonine dehydratase